MLSRCTQTFHQLGFNLRNAVADNCKIYLMNANWLDEQPLPQHSCIFFLLFQVGRLPTSKQLQTTLPTDEDRGWGRAVHGRFWYCSIPLIVEDIIEIRGLLVLRYRMNHVICPMFTVTPLELATFCNGRRAKKFELLPH